MAARQKVSGLYRIRHLDSGKVYIGSSSDIHSRWLAHRRQLSSGAHHSIRLQRAWLKHGPDAFVFEVVREVEANGLIDAEADLIAAYKAADELHGYNSAPAAGTTLGIKLGPLPESHRRKIAEAKIGRPASDESRKNQSAARKGRALSADWKAKIAASMTGKKLPPLSDEHKAIVSATHKGKTISAEHKRRLSLAHTGRTQSEETRRLRSESVKAAWARRKALASQG